jgi:hypothetical protein
MVPRVLWYWSVPKPTPGDLGDEYPKPRRYCYPHQYFCLIGCGLSPRLCIHHVSWWATGIFQCLSISDEIDEWENMTNHCELLSLLRFRYCFRLLLLASGLRRPTLTFALVFLGSSLPALASTPPEVTHWRSGLIEVDQGWLAHDGDDMEWSRPKFDDSAWNAMDLNDLGPARAGWHWYRRQVNFGADQRDLRLLIAGGDGTYELFVNGIKMPGPALRTSLMVGRPVEAVFPVRDSNGLFELALRTRIPAGYGAWHLPQFTNVTMGLPTAIEYERQALESQRLSGLAPSLCINLLLCLAGVSALALYAIQQTQREYIFLGLYLLLVGISDGLSVLQSSGLVPLSANFLIADPLIYAWVIAQIEFTYCFAGRPVSRIWRIYEISLLIPLTLAALTWIGRFASDTTC